MSMTAKYTSGGSILATIDGVEMTIPNDPSNRHYAELIANGVTIEPVAVPTLADIRAHAIAAMGHQIDVFTAQFTSGVPAAELASWPTKTSEAEKVLEGGTSAMIDAEAKMMGQTAQEVATVIAETSAEYTTIIGKVSGLRRKTEAAINKATDEAGVADVLKEALLEAEKRIFRVYEKKRRKNDL